MNLPTTTTDQYNILFMSHYAALKYYYTVVYTVRSIKSVVPSYSSYNGKYCELLVLVEAAARLVLFLERRELALLRLLLLNL